MTEAFVPLMAARNKNGESPFSNLKAKAAPAVPGAKAAGALEQPTDCETKPVVTLQRTGDLVTGIRVQCGCGQVIDLACVY